MKTRIIAWIVSLVSVSTALAQSCADFTKLRDKYLTQYKPLWLESAAAWWEANISGADAAFDRKKVAEKKITELHSDRAAFAKFKALKESGTVRDPVEARELDVIYRAYLAGQADPELQNKIIDIQNEVEQIFNTHRAKVGDRELTENDIRDIVGKSQDSAAAEQAWKGYMAVGEKARDKLVELVRLRNQMARELGFRDFFAMSLALQEIDETELFRIMDELAALTREPYEKLKSEIDASRARNFSIETSALRPWHFGDLFFQEAPRGENYDFDSLYKSIDLVAMTRDYYAGIGLPCDDILARSDMYEKPGKSPHAFCSDLNREGDIRTLCNIKQNLYWADTVVHEVGHGVYDKYIRRDVPWLLREASHGITTEGLAMMFGSLVLNEDWLNRVVKLDAAEAKKATSAATAAGRAQKLIFAQWAQVMVRFERGMYADPSQDLGKLWWELKARYQRLPAPETTDRPDYAAKVHVLVSPVYYHNYLLGELFAAQLRNTLATKVAGVSDPAATCFAGDKKVGEFLSREVLGPGNLFAWNDLTKRATGEPLSAKYFVQQYAK